ncbi:MAG: outer membrane beta-barrel protein [Massilia sp.]
MKKFCFALALTIASVGAFAQTAPVAPEQSAVRFLVGGGLTFGGDTLGTATYTNGTVFDLHAGGLVDLHAGLDFLVTPSFSLQSTIGYHVDDASARNGDLRFHRMPLELLAYYHVNPKWRLGGGARYLSSVKLSSSGAAAGQDVDFDNTVSAVLEGEYLLSRHWGFKVRLVSEKLKVSGTSKTFDADHIGLMANYYF